MRKRLGQYDRFDWDSIRGSPGLRCLLRETETATFKEILNPKKKMRKNAKTKLRQGFILRDIDSALLKKRLCLGRTRTRIF